MRQPNILFLFADEWRAQATGYAGDPNCRTPRLDGLAAESIDGVNAVAGCSVCCPYRASLMTGQYPLSHGVFINDVELDPDCHSLARAFGAAGYHTSYVGKWHLYGSPEGTYERRAARVPRSHQLGFDHWRGFECTHDYWDTPYWVDDDPEPHHWAGYEPMAQSQWIADQLRQRADDEQPFLLMGSWGPPHFPLHTAPEKWRQHYAGRDIVLRPNVPPQHRDRAVDDLRGYYAHIAALDECLAVVLDALEETGLADDTILVVTADHGDMRSSQGLETKLFPFEESVRVPFLLRWPRAFGRQASTFTPPIDAPDLMPTLLGLAGLAVPASCQGTDWSPILRGERVATGDEAALLIMAAEFTELRFNGMRAYRGLRTATHTYVRNLDGPWLLYDLQADPYQMRNLVGRPEAAAVQADLESRLQQKLDGLGDRFLPGEVYCQQAGYSHYRELSLPMRSQWHDPWAG